MTDDDQRAAVECMARGICRSLYPAITDPEMNLPAKRWAGDTHGDLDMSVLQDHELEAAAALRALLDAGWSVSRWQPIKEYKGHNQVWCWHERDRWFRVGRTLPHHGSRWYYTGSSDPEPTHFMILPEPPK